MVLVRRKKVLLHDLPPSIASNDAQNNPDAPQDVYYINETGEIFVDYESYAARMTFYKMNIFSCEVTGKGGLDFFQALKSEQSEATVAHARFPDQLKAAVLRAVQWQIVGRLDHLVEAVYDRFKDRYFKGEKVYIDIQGDRYLARIVKVFPPRNLKLPPSTTPLKLKLKLSGNSPLSTSMAQNGSTEPSTDATNLKPPSKYKPSPSQRVARSYPGSPFNNYVPEASSPLSRPVDDGGSDVDAKNLPPVPPLIQPEPHAVGSNMKLSLEESIRLDDPAAYFYSVQLISEGETESITRTGTPDPEGNGGSQWAGTEMEVTCATMSRDRLGFNKALLKRFLKDSLDRSTAVASPWIVKEALAEKYGIETQMPHEVKLGVEGVKKADHEKRKKIWEEREGPPSKKQKKAHAEEAKAKELERQRELELEAEAEKALQAKLKAAVKKKPVRYPTEDLDVKMSDRERKSGKPVARPMWSRDVPFESSFESFLMVWNFLVSFGRALNLSPFTLDELEHAIRHNDPQVSCLLIAEIHYALMTLIRERPFTRHAAVMSLLDLKTSIEEDGDNAPKDEHEREEDWQVEIDELLKTIANSGSKWESTMLKEKDGREGWEVMLVGFLKDYATCATFPRLRQVLTYLHYEAQPGDGDDGVVQPCHPADAYPVLPVEDKIAILVFLCEQAVTCKGIRTALEIAETDLTDLRKEKIEVNRERKRLQEEINAANASAPTDTEANGTNGANGTENGKPSESNGDADMSMDGGASDADSERQNDASSDVASEAGWSSRAPSTTRQISNPSLNPTPKTIAHAKERALAREKAAEAKAAQAEHRRMDEELAKLDKRLEAIERDFRKTMGMARSRPLGKDRFYHRLWWFDGYGAAGLLGSNGGVTYGTGRIFIQGPSEIDRELLQGREDQSELTSRIETEGPLLASNEWACYSDPEEVEKLVAWFNLRGTREFQLDKSLKTWWDYIIPGMKKRMVDLASAQKPVDPSSRRSSRKSDLCREPYMMWTNKFLKNNSNGTK
ncbi:hypothetical protein FRC02_000617 [Tulasnella sp. 418]|nr:hypothetical protein FRC02_000617 [Tulasnella sp. 418]